MTTRPNDERSGLGSVARVRGAAVVLVLASACAVSGADSPLPPREGRIRPPEDAPCPRDVLTLYAGAVTGYERTDDTLDLRVRTDWDTEEAVTFDVGDATLLPQRMRLDDKPFTASDWTRIESSRKAARSGLRVKVWLCREGTAVKPARIDWETGQDPAKARPPR